MNGTTTCRCECGYTCGGQCGLDVVECMQTHWRADCDHDRDGPSWESEDGRAGSVSCSKCGVTAMQHDMAVGP